MGKRTDWENFENEYLKVVGKSSDEVQEERNKNRKNKTTFFDCECKRCGNIFPVSQQNLKNTKSCGCPANRFMDNWEDEIGNKYGRLTILKLDVEATEKYNTNGNHRGLYYVCECECGTRKTYRLSALRCGHIKSCGCSMFNNPLNFDDLTGKRFGRLVVLRRDLERDLTDRENGIYRVHWICKCDCGNEISTTAKCLKTGETKSCGCINRERLIKFNILNKGKFNRPEQYKFNDKGETLDGAVRFWDEENNYSFLVSEEDADFISRWYWRKDVQEDQKHQYWITNAKKKDREEGRPSTLKVHQLVAERKYGEYDKKLYVPDHLSRDVDDNRRENIVLKTNQENCKNRSTSSRNKSGKTGVYQYHDGKRWCASVGVNMKTIFLGVFDKFEDAVKARKDAEIKYGFTCDDVYPEYDTKEVSALCTN